MNEWPARLKVDPIGQWPGVRTMRQQRSPFSASLSATLEVLEREIRELGGRDARMQIAIPPEQFRLDGYPRATAKPEHSGVILTLQSKHGALSYPCDTFTTWQDNLRAIALALEALRKVDRYGVTKRGEQYRGFLALEATAMPASFASADDAAGFLMSKAHRGYVKGDREGLRAVVRLAKANTHPDRGGDAAEFDRVMRAVALLEREGLL